MDMNQLHRFIVKPVLKYMGLSGHAAEQLVVGTALTESNLQYIDQITSSQDVTLGPAYGLYQIEPNTLGDLYDNYLKYHKQRKNKFDNLLASYPSNTIQLATNLYYATAACRLIYYRQPRALPEANDLRGLADYWKTYYNTSKGKGTIGQFLAKASPVLRLENYK